jgi:hypothetical protein
MRQDVDGALTFAELEEEMELDDGLDIKPVKKARKEGKASVFESSARLVFPSPGIRFLSLNFILRR